MKKSNHTFAGKIRIIGGQWRNRKLPVLLSSGLQPTTNQARETLFNWLAPSIVGASCLDCFAGSGALGIEGLSRYAAKATLLEKNCKIAEQLRKNLEILKAKNASIVRTDTLIFLDRPGTPHNIVFVDPPFYKGLLRETLFLLEKNGWLSDQALIYVESELGTLLPVVPDSWVLFRGKSMGKVYYYLYSRNRKSLTAM